MTQPVIRVIDGRHVVGLTEAGIDWRPLESFATPREAIDFSDRYDDSTPRSAPVIPPSEECRGETDQGRSEAPVRDTSDVSEPDDPALTTLGAGSVGATTSAGNPVPACAGCGGPTPLGRREGIQLAGGRQTGPVRWRTYAPRAARQMLEDAGVWDSPNAPGLIDFLRDHPGTVLMVATVDYEGPGDPRDLSDVPAPSGGVDSQQPAPLGVRAALPGADPGTHPPGL